MFDAPLGCEVGSYSRVLMLDYSCLEYARRYRILPVGFTACVRMRVSKEPARDSFVYAPWDSWLGLIVLILLRTWALFQRPQPLYSTISNR
jgi:hypothetical protein